MLKRPESDIEQLEQEEQHRIYIQKNCKKIRRKIIETNIIRSYSSPREV